MNHYITRPMINRLYKIMKDKGITTSQICKVLNVGYCDFKSMLEGKSPCYNKHQKKIAELLEVDRDILFREFKECD